MSDNVHVDALHDVLCHHRRRCVLTTLSDRDADVAVADLAAEVAAQERDDSGSDLSPDDVKSVQLALFHRHLPKLADADIVDYDPNRSTVRYQNHPGVDELLDVHSELDCVRVD